ncbi:putative membrane protein YphA (DoxX/SURF4 family) [Arthrobacter sp. UYEF21]
MLLLGAAALAFALTGAGRISVDRAVFGRMNNKLAVLA